MADPKQRDYGYQILLPQEAISFDVSAFDAMLRANGVTMVHYRAIKCPIGITDPNDVRAHNEHDNCSNGFIYKKAGEVTVFFNSNNSNARLEDIGIIDGSTCFVTVPRFYDDPANEEVAIQHYDRFFMKDYEGFSVNTQLIEAHVTGIDRLQYEPTLVETVIDANGVEYGDGDFAIRSGAICWGSKRPQFRADLGKGTVFTVRYRYTPFFYVNNIMHEVRVSRVYDYQKDERVLVRMPYGLQLQREYVHENEARQPQFQHKGGVGSDDARTVRGPRSGSYGPR